MGIIERIKLFREHLGLGQTAFEVNVGVAKGYFSNVKTLGSDKIMRIYEKYPILNIEWLITGKGNMLRSNEYNHILNSPKVVEKEPSPQEGGANLDKDYRLVPIIHIDSVGGIHSPNAITDETQYIEGYAPFTDAKDGDICIVQSGNSMTPTCPSGSLLLLREVSNWKEYFGYGNIFVMELVDGRRITKEVSRYDDNPKDFIWCISHNPNVPDEELPKSMIASVWKVIKIQIDKGW